MDYLQEWLERGAGQYEHWKSLKGFMEVVHYPTAKFVWEEICRKYDTRDVQEILDRWDNEKEGDILSPIYYFLSYESMAEIDMSRFLFEDLAIDQDEGFTEIFSPLGKFLKSVRQSAVIGLLELINMIEE